MSYPGPNEFATPGSNQYPPQGLRPTNKKATPALVCSIIGIFIGLFAIPGLILGIMSRKEIKASNGYETGEGKALASIIISGIVIALTVIGIVAIIAVSGHSK